MTDRASMAIKKNQPAKIILSLLLLGCAAAFAFNPAAYNEAIVSAFFAIALASVVILHLRVRPMWSEASLVLACTLLFAIVDLGILKYPPRIMIWFSFLGLSSLLLLGIRAVWAEGEDRKLYLYAWIPALLFVTSEWFASSLLEWTAAAHPKTLDLYLLSFDSSMILRLCFVVGGWFYYWPWLRFFSLIFYIGLPIPIALIYVGQLVRVREKAFPTMLAFLVTGPVGILFYNLFPGAGPHNLFGPNFPFHPLPVDQAARLILEPIALQGPRNAMPSLHMAWTLLAWWYSRGLSRWERGIALAFVIFTVLSTLGTGEHFFIDLIVAYPFALFVHALCSYTLPLHDARRLSAFAFGLLGTLTWFLALRYAGKFFWISPVIPWALAAATVALTTIRQSNFQAALDTGPAAQAMPSGVSASREARVARS